jgi:hypothetical protein
MTEPENFLTRWSRRKREPEETTPPAASEPAPPQKAGMAEEAAKNTVADTPAPAFDPASLPSLDSIGAETDITAFMKPGVPGDLRVAALRRAWVSDPAIRDFKGLAENDWDFTVPNETMGFGEIDPGFDTKKMLAQVFGDTPRESEPARDDAPAAEQTPPQPQQLDSPQSVTFDAAEEVTRAQTIDGTEEMVRRKNNDASHADEDAQETAGIARRRPQGGALPQ